MPARTRDVAALGFAAPRVVATWSDTDLLGLTRCSVFGIDRTPNMRHRVTALVAGPGPLVAMELQAIMNRATAKQGTDLQDIARLILDEQARPPHSPNSANAMRRLPQTSHCTSTSGW